MKINYPKEFLKECHLCFSYLICFYKCFFVIYIHFIFILFYMHMYAIIYSDFFININCMLTYENDFDKKKFE